MTHRCIVNLGLPKTGTTSLGDALGHAGLAVADWKIRQGQGDDPDLVDQHVGKILYDDYFNTGNPLTRLARFDVINEMSALTRDYSLWPQTDWGILSAIMAHCPDVQFILPWRVPSQTVDSMMRWNNLGKKRLPQADLPGLPRGFGTCEPQLIRWLEGHYAFCRRVFAGADNFLEYDIESPDAQDVVAEYLGLELPWWGISNVGKPSVAARSV